MNNIQRTTSASQDCCRINLNFFISYCTAPLGSIQELPAESCGEIKASEGNNMANSEYWIYSDGSAGQEILARCDGMTLIHLHVIPLRFRLTLRFLFLFNTVKLCHFNVSHE